MCQAELNVSTQDCRHRWYRLVKSCNPEGGTNLSNCTNRLSFQGMEVRCAFCPFCDSWTTSPGDMKLIGSDRHPSVGGISRHASFGGGATLVNARKESRSRRGSLARTDSSGSITTMVTGLETLTRMASEKNKAMNHRLDSYLSTLPTWGENAGTASPRRGSQSSSDDTVTGDSPNTTPATTPSEPDASFAMSRFTLRDDKRPNKLWTRSKRLSRSMNIFK